MSTETKCVLRNEPLAAGEFDGIVGEWENGCLVIWDTLHPMIGGITLDRERLLHLRRIVEEAAEHQLFDD